jgi:hypothetical protein
MVRSRPLLCAVFFCEHCKKETRFLPIHFAVAVTGVCRRTVYYWMERSWVHWRELPSGRRVICEQSLSRQARSSPPISIPHNKVSAKVSKPGQSGKLTRS